MPRGWFTTNLEEWSDPNRDDRSRSRLPARVDFPAAGTHRGCTTAASASRCRFAMFFVTSSTCVQVRHCAQRVVLLDVKARLALRGVRGPMHASVTERSCPLPSASRYGYSFLPSNQDPRERV